MYITNVYDNTIHFNAYPMFCHGKHAVNACVLSNFQSKVKNYYMTNYNLSYSYKFVSLDWKLVKYMYNL